MPCVRALKELIAMPWSVRIGFLVAAAAIPSAAWATEAAMPLANVVLGSVGAVGVGVAGIVCLKLYSSLRGGRLGAAWQSAAYALLLFSAALIVETCVGAGWFEVPQYTTGVLKLIGAAWIAFSFMRFSKVFR